MPPVAPPYTKTLSALRKTELVRLSNEFRLPTEGSVVVLRNRLKTYLNAHNEALYRNPRYRALYPKHRQMRLGPAIVPPRSPTLSERSFDSWHGIGANRPPTPPSPAHSSRHSRLPTPQLPPQQYDFLPPPSNHSLPLQEEQPVVDRKFSSPDDIFVAVFSVIGAFSSYFGYFSASGLTIFLLLHYTSGLLCDHSPPL